MESSEVKHQVLGDFSTLDKVETLIQAMEENQKITDPEKRKVIFVPDYVFLQYIKQLKDKIKDLEEKIS